MAQALHGKAMARHAGVAVTVTVTVTVTLTLTLIGQLHLRCCG